MNWTLRGRMWVKKRAFDNFFVHSGGYATNGIRYRSGRMRRSEAYSRMGREHFWREYCVCLWGWANTKGMDDNKVHTQFVVKAL